MNGGADNKPKPASEHPERVAAVDRICELVERHGVSQQEAIKIALAEGQLDLHPATIRKWAEKYYKPLPALRPFKEMRQVAHDYARGGRARVTNKFILAVEKSLEEHLESVEKGEGPVLMPRDLKELAITFGIAADKRTRDDAGEQEDTEAAAAQARQRLGAKWDELAARRARREATGA